MTQHSATQTLQASDNPFAITTFNGLGDVEVSLKWTTTVTKNGNVHVLNGPNIFEQQPS